MKFRILDLFCGAGGLSYGFDKLENYETLLGLDFDNNAIKTFEKNHSKAIGIYGDITDDNTRKYVIDKAIELKINMVVGGPPCQGFSLKGKLKGLDDPRNFLFLEFIKVVKEVRPEVFVIENVKNLINAVDGYFIEQIRKRFVDLGYIVNYGVLNSKYFGVPQNRERAIIIGSLSKKVALPEQDREAPIVTVRDAIQDLAYLNSGEGSVISEYINKPTSNYQKLMRGERLHYHKATNHSPDALKKLMFVPPEGDKSSIPQELHGKQKFTTTWSRLIWDDVSPTIDTRFDTPSNGRNSHPFLHRAITPREAARIQSFDDNFIFEGSKTSVCKQIGNAVPPLLATAIAQSIINAYTTREHSGNNYQIFNANSFDIIHEFKKKKLFADHIITDPPYNISKANNFNTMNSPRAGVDFGEWDKNFDLFGWIKDFSSILKKDGSIIIFCSYLYISHLIDELERCNITVKDIIIWKKSNPMPRNVNRRYVQDMEFAIWGVKKNSKWIFNKPEDTPYLRSIYEAPLVSGKEKNGHPTQKSLKIMRNIIEVHTEKDQIVLDPFMGSGTTGVAALETNRKFIGVELNEKYYELSLNRLKEL